MSWAGFKKGVQRATNQVSTTLSEQQQQQQHKQQQQQ